MFDGSAWQPVGSEGPDGSSVAALESIGGALYAGGVFQLGGEDAHVAVWNGTAWSDLNAGMSDIVEAIVVADEGVYVGGRVQPRGRLSLGGPGALALHEVNVRSSTLAILLALLALSRAPRGARADPTGAATPRRTRWCSSSSRPM